MFVSKEILQVFLKKCAENKIDQGHELDLERFLDELEEARDSYDKLDGLARELASLAIRSDWSYVEPNDWGSIVSEMSGGAREGYWEKPDLNEAADRVQAAFEGSVCGCMLGKPIEVNPTLEEIREAAQQTDQWPLNDYFPEETLLALGRRNNSWKECVSEKIEHIAPDDDINYTLTGMLLLEEFGVDLTKERVRDLWLLNIPPLFSWGPERTQIIKTAINSLPGGIKEVDESWVETLNHGDELCGAVIRADAYGYACPGNPLLASKLAYIDASFTHRRTGIYATQYVAAVISLCFLMAGDEQGNDRLRPFEQALAFIPQKSRFHRIVSDSLMRVKESDDWLEAYESIHGKYKQYSHCQVYQEIGTLINTLKFASDVGDGICKQVSQGNDTDSFGATVGSILGVFFGPGHLQERWLKPFNNTIHTSLADFHEQRLDVVVGRLRALPSRIWEQLQERGRTASPDEPA